MLIGLCSEMLVKKGGCFKKVYMQWGHFETQYLKKRETKIMDLSQK